MNMMRAYYNLLLGLVSLVLIIELATSSEYEEVYIVYMGKTTSRNGVLRSDHAQLLNELNTRKENVVVQTYHKSFLGFAARLSKTEAQSFAQRPGVVSVFPNRALKPHTTRSWDFLMTQNAPGFKTSTGFAPTTSPRVSNLSFGGAHDTIIGILDSGIWPDHPSFNDEHMSPVPTLWKGICMPGENVTNKFSCNKKVIGARYYEDTDYPGSITTPMDGSGHGTHAASTAAGRQVEGASYYGLAKGIARGGSQGSRIAVYRVCGRGGCWSVSILKAFDDAIADGVDVISISIGGGFDDFFEDPTFIGSFHAAEKGITVVGSAGNSGPSPMTVENVAPWMFSVGATTIDRNFESDIVLAPNQKKIKGGGINFSGLSSSAIHPIIDGRSAATSNQSNIIANASYCVPDSLDDQKVNGKIVLCDDDVDSHLFFDKIKRLEKQGAIGIIIINNYFTKMPYYYGTSPVVVVTVDDGAQLRSYIETNRNPLATILPTVVTSMNYKPAPVIADFSARGPILNIENLLKPDVAAPGVGILAAWPPFHDRTVIPGKEPPLFDIDTGTSMSCPHASGVAATVKSLHPTWGSSAIRSAIMTTAIQTNNLHVPITTGTGSRATPYDIGAGEISLLGPLCPGLVYETETIEYIHFLCNMGYNTSIIQMISPNVPLNFNCPSNSSPDLISDMNYPSMVVSGITPNRMRSVKRTLTNVGEEYSNYVATVEAPSGVQVRVVPNKLRFTKNVRKQTFEVIFTVTTSSIEEDLFGAFTWSNWKHKVRSPFVVARTKK